MTWVSAGTRRRVLVVEDEESISEPLAAALDRAGFEVSVAASASEGSRRFAAERPDVVLLDVMLPDGDGRDVLREMRPSGVPIVMLTARSDPIDKVVGLELGADDYVTKPFDTAELIARVAAVLAASTRPRRVPRDRSTRRAPRVGDVEVDLDTRKVHRAGRVGRPRVQGVRAAADPVSSTREPSCGAVSSWTSSGARTGTDPTRSSTST